MACDVDLIKFSSRAVMAERLADLIEARLAASIAQKSRAAIGVSGGSTPAALYEALSHRPLNWSKVSAALVDERWVPPGADGSNESFVRGALIRNEASAMRLVGMWSDAADPKAGLVAAGADYEALGDFDVVVLGMGADGHTASWFPHCEGLEEALRDESGLAAIRAQKSEVTGDFLDRMTLTLGSVRRAELVVLLINGEEKRAAFEAVSAGGTIEDAPVRAILNARDDLWAAWAP